VFAYAGDLWRVPREGGDAERLTSGVGIESDPSFSPDGSRIAFTGQYDGNIDVFVVAASGGVPTRLTYHPLADEVVGGRRTGAGSCCLRAPQRVVVPAPVHRQRRWRLP